MSKSDKDGMKQEKLLSDEDFAQLMDTEFSSQTDAEDEITQQRIWKKIEPELVTKAPRQKIANWMSIAAAAVLVLAIAPLLFITDEQETLRPKGNAAASPATFTAFRVSDAGGLTVAPERLDVGDTLLFKVKLLKGKHVAMAVTVNQGAPKVRFVTRFDSLESEQLLQRDGKSYGYQFAESDKQVRFCLITAETEIQLQELANKLATTWLALPASACREYQL